MIPAPFEYERAASVDDAIEMLTRGGEDAKLLAGGHSLLPLMKLRLARPTLLIDIGRLDALSGITEDGGWIRIGALTRHHDLEHSQLLRERCGLVAHVAGLVGDPQVRHRGTIGGALAHGDPASDVPSALLALGAQLVARGPSGERTIAVHEFFTGLFETELSSDEVLTEVRVRALGDEYGWTYEKFNRRALDWAVVGIAAVVRRDGETIGEARVALTNMGSTPVRATATEGALAGVGVDGIAGAADHAADGTSPPSDTNASAEFRQQLARVLTRRAVEQAFGRRG